MHVGYCFALAIYQLSYVLRWFLDTLTITADADANSSGSFICTSLSSTLIYSGASVNITSSTIDLACNLTGFGDVSVTCDHGCVIALGGDTNLYSSATNYHVSNSMLQKIQISKSLTIGSPLASNVSEMFVDGYSHSPNGSGIVLAVSQGSISFLNASSTIALRDNASFEVLAAENISVGALLSVSASGGSSGVKFVSDSDCTTESDESNQDSHFIVSSNGSLLVDTAELTEVQVLTPRLLLEGLVNVTDSTTMMIEGS